MRSFGFFRRKNRLGQGGSPTRWRAIPFDMAPAPERGAVMQRVQQLTESLEGAIDEGTGASLDLLIESWARSWIAIVETEYVNHCAVISMHRGQAQQWLTKTTATAQHEREELGRDRTDYLASRQRLTGELADPTLPGAPLAVGIQDPERSAGPGVPATDATVPTPADRPAVSVPRLQQQRGGGRRSPPRAPRLSASGPLSRPRLPAGRAIRSQSARAAARRSLGTASNRARMRSSSGRSGSNSSSRR